MPLRKFSTEDDGGSKASPLASSTPVQATTAALDDLLALLKDENPGHRHAASDQLAHLDDCIPLLARLLANLSHGSCREMVAITLMKARSDLVADLVVPLLRHDSAEIRGLAVEVLGHHAAFIAARAPQWLAGEDPLLKLQLLSVVQGHDSKGMVRSLAEALTTEADANVAAQLLDMILLGADADEEGERTRHAACEIVLRRFGDIPFLRFIATGGTAREARG
ncbi:HEAT repeat domain-containing protein [Rhizobium straminoryzae]|uniref:HEAT repeat domain-containing protein n=1 Tax=Rhizobium straminoryzae TaxID=1387186 RepID=A0A549T8I9_9HYPH|nr:HEAT repeat domain-containing protein [Rhizobium straminoryzae]TRL38175.1 HEAT repeat domain-containing protein [Rhizobium straminoryzae]